MEETPKLSPCALANELKETSSTLRMILWVERVIMISLNNRTRYISRWLSAKHWLISSYCNNRYLVATKKLLAFMLHVLLSTPGCWNVCNQPFYGEPKHATIWEVDILNICKDSCSCLQHLFRSTEMTSYFSLEFFSKPIGRRATVLWAFLYNLSDESGSAELERSWWTPNMH